MPILGLAWLWYGGYFDTADHVVMLVTIGALFVATITPAKSYSSKERYILAGIYIAGAVATCIDIYGSYSIGYGPDYVAMTLKSIYLLIFVVLIKNSLFVSQEVGDA